MAKYWDMDGNEIELQEWSRLFASEERKIASNRIPERAMTVSTVWLGLSWLAEDERGAKPLIFETMAFAEDSYDDLGCWRWQSREDAVAGHERIVGAILGGSMDLNLDDGYRMGIE